MSDTIKKHAFKIQVGTAVAVLIFCIGMTFKVTTAFNAMESSILHVEGKTELYAERYDIIEGRVDKTELNYVEIKTKLGGIETMLIDIKERIK